MTNLKPQLGPKPLDLFQRIGSLADAMDVRVYVVGGFVRDLLLGKSVMDIDLMVEGSAVDLAQQTAKIYKVTASAESQFGTVALELMDGFRLDFATCRKETYTKPAALPDVARGTLEEDLLRRDFTINSMALPINGVSAYELIALSGAEEDLKRGLIRAHHAQSFRDDPCRILRGLRFQNRLNFRWEPDSEGWMRDALEQKMPGQLSGVRFWNEFKLAFTEDNAVGCLHLFRKEGLIAYLASEITDSETGWEALGRVGSCLDEGSVVDFPYLYLLALTSHLSEETLKEIAGRLQWNRQLKNRLSADSHTIEERLGRLQDASALSDWDIHQVFDALSPEALACVFARFNDNRVFAWYGAYCKNRSRARIELTGNDLALMGVAAGPVFAAILKGLRRARFEGVVNSREDEARWVREHYLSS
ncbi:MAG: CCA tRNA nucleotidyltransferase [Candidatus Nitrohelix vancouverensis]|uniref:CCA tRNA nucleotidyltransferase n=1 Tax=Candidatus Nitrohelix vancouverensis TaxID=2705534 RepID=A0A7T0C4P6_9BACT|nr:MAG: CCA tRNA nucleotidyltransferase [Candidatus Nitrohelix vancouverensis]